MTLIVPSVGETAFLEKILNQNLKLRLFSNNVTPAEGDTLGTYTQVAGGGYAEKTLVFANWTMTTGDPSYALYLKCNFNFTGVTNAPGTVYGYYIVDANGILVTVERFAPGVLPFSPINGSLIRITPRIELS